MPENAEKSAEKIGQRHDLWVCYAGITEPGDEQYELSDLEPCGIRKEYWDMPTASPSTAE